MDVVGSITGFFRNILWSIIYLLLWVTDTIWQVVMKIATLDFFDKGNVAEWFTAISGGVQDKTGPDSSYLYDWRCFIQHCICSNRISVSE